MGKKIIHLYKWENVGALKKFLNIGFFLQYIQIMAQVRIFSLSKRKKLL
jgi:hypothetical protein